MPEIASLPVLEAASSEISYEKFLTQCQTIAAEWIDGRVEAVNPNDPAHARGLATSEGNRRIRDFLSGLMHLYADHRNFGLVTHGGEYAYAGANLRLVGQCVGRRPDIMFISESNRVHMQKPAFSDPITISWGTGEYREYIPGYFHGTPELVVEIVDRFSRQRDRVTKFAEYQRAGIPEYWLIEDEHYSVSETAFFQSDTTGVYQNVPLNAYGVPHVQNAAFFQLNADGVYQNVPFDAEGIYRSRSFPGFWLREQWLWQSPAPAMSTLQKEFGLP